MPTTFQCRYQTIKWLPQPIGFVKTIKNISDSLTLSERQRTTLINLYYEKKWNKIIATSSDFFIPRTDLKATANFLSFIPDNVRNFAISCTNTITTDSICAFIGENYANTYNKTRDFYNFYLKNNRWEDLKLNDLLDIQGEKRVQMNDLFVKKIKALKDAQIDCSNTSAFVTQVENRWQLTSEGVQFYFDSSADVSVTVVVAFTWAELSPFLKLRIY